MREGPPRYYATIQPREFGLFPGVLDYVECRPDGVSIYLEVITVQDYVKQTFDRCGSLWSRDKILLKLAEEVGELIKSYRKESVDQQQHEFGDVLFTILALAVREGVDANQQLCATVVRFERLCNNLAQEQNQHSTQPSLDRSSVPLYGSYTQRCTFCFIPIHKTNTTKLCSDCRAIRKALVGNMGPALTDKNTNAQN